MFTSVRLPVTYMDDFQRALKLGRKVKGNQASKQKRLQRRISSLSLSLLPVYIQSSYAISLAKISKATAHSQPHNSNTNAKSPAKPKIFFHPERVPNPIFFLPPSSFLSFFLFSPYKTCNWLLYDVSRKRSKIKRFLKRIEIFSYF